MPRPSCRRYAPSAPTTAPALDSARRYHEVTLELLPLLRPANCLAAGAQADHLEPDDIPADILGRIQAADMDLTAALAKVK